MSKIEDLVCKFHALEGTTLSERRRNFDRLLRQLRSELISEEDIETFLTSLTPETELEEAYVIDILTALDRNERLLKILKAGNPVHIGKLLKHWKFFQSAFQTIDEDMLVNDVFPHVSFSTRMKIINRLYKNLKNEEKADAYFHAIENQYGLKVASAILPGCSIDLIKSVIAKYKLKLTGRHLLAIVKKERTFLDFYFALLGDFNFSSYYQDVLKYLAKTNPVLYWELCDKYKLKIKFGRHMTPYVLQAKEDVLKSYNALYYFNRRQLSVFLKKNEPECLGFISAMYPKKLQNFSGAFPCIKDFLKYLPKYKQYEIINKCFVETYGKNLTDEFSLSQEVLKIMPVAEREVILDVRVPEDDSLIYLYPPKKSISMLKDKIKHTSDREKRAQLIYQLVETCRICVDDDSLLAVLKYYLFRHKNDLYTLNEFLRKLTYYPKIEKLSAEHWKCMNELLKIMSVSRIFSCREYNFMEKYLQHLWENKLPYEEYLRDFLKYIADNQYCISVFTGQRNYQKMCLEYFMALIPQMFEEQKYKDMCLKMLNAIMVYNTTYSDNPIPINHYAEIIDVVKETAKIQEFQSKDIINYVIKFAYEKDGIYDSFFWDHYKKMHTCNMVLWYLKNDPLRILENIDKLFLDLPETSQCRHVGYRWWRKPHQQNCNLDMILQRLSKFCHLNIPEKLLDFALETLKNRTDHVDYAVKILSHLGTAGQYLFVYYQADENTRRKLARNLCNVNPPYATLQLLREFCTQKYAKTLQKSLYHIICNISENSSAEFFANFYKFPTSFKKHAINLSTTIATKQGMYDFLKQVGAEETSRPLKRIVFKLTMKYFNQNPSDMFWDLLKSNFNLIEPKDRETHSILLNLNKIPHNYRPQYVSLIYHLLSENAEREINQKKYHLLERIPPDIIGQLDVEFLKSAVADTLFNQELQKTSMEWIGLKFIFHAQKENQSKMLQLASSILKDYVALSFDGTARNKVSDYVSEFCKNFINLHVDLKLIDEFQTLWSTIFNPDDIFEENLLLSFTRAYVKCSIEEFAVKADEILTDVVGTYGPTVVDLFANALTKFLNEFACLLDDDVKMAEFFEHFCAASKVPQAFVVVIMISVKNHQQQEPGVLKMIQDCKTLSVQIYLKHYAMVFNDAEFSFLY